MLIDIRITRATNVNHFLSLYRPVQFTRLGLTNCSSGLAPLPLINENAWALTPPPASCPLCQYFCWKMSWCDVATSWRDVVTSRDIVTSWHDVRWRLVMTECTKIWPIRNFGNHVFQPGDLDLWPMTLTFELIRDIMKVNVSTTFWVSMSNGSAVRALTDRHMHTHTHRWDRFHTLDRWHGREQAPRTYLAISASSRPRK